MTFMFNQQLDYGVFSLSEDDLVCFLVEKVHLEAEVKIMNQFHLLYTVDSKKSETLKKKPTTLTEHGFDICRHY